MEGVPEFADEEEFFALDDAFFECTGNTLAGFDLIAIVFPRVSLSENHSIFKVDRQQLLREGTLSIRTASTVKESVASLDSIVHSVCTSLVRDLP